MLVSVLRAEWSRRRGLRGVRLIVRSVVYVKLKKRGTGSAVTSVIVDRHQESGNI